MIDLTEVCGANKYHYLENRIEFVITNNPSCRPRLILTNSIQLTAKFEMDFNVFFQMDGRTKFISRIAALLNIQDHSRIKVAGIWRGSVNIKAFIEPSSPVAEENATEVSEE